MHLSTLALVFGALILVNASVFVGLRRVARLFPRRERKETSEATPDPGPPPAPMGKPHLRVISSREEKSS